MKAEADQRSCKDESARRTRMAVFPEIAGEPGWRSYAAGALNQHNPLVIVMPDLAAYLQRVSFLLRQGRKPTIVAVYLPSSDARASFAAAARRSARPPSE